MRALELQEETRGLVYISGPITGKLAGNAPAFDQCAHALREAGYPVINPIELDRERGFDIDRWDGHSPIEGFDLDKVLADDIRCITRCDMVVVLPGWEHSSGATLEVAVATRLGKAVAQWDPVTASLCHLDLSAIIAVCHGSKIYGRSQ